MSENRREAMIELRWRTIDCMDLMELPPNAVHAYSCVYRVLEFRNVVQNETGLPTVTDWIEVPAHFEKVGD